MNPKRELFKNIPTYYSDFPFTSGTEISVVNLNSIVIHDFNRIKRDIKPMLGARYRRFLSGDNKRMELELIFYEKTNQESLFDVCRTKDGIYKLKSNLEVEEVKPIYFHPTKRNNKPVILKHQISGKGWKAELTFGYAPQDKEYEEIGLPITSKSDPYYVSMNKQGLDILLHDRVILFHQLFELDIVPNRHADYNVIRGEIDLKEGFETAITKNSIINDNHFRQCLEKIRKILKGEEPGTKNEKRNYLRTRISVGELPEKLLRDRLAKHLKSHPIMKKNNVVPEYKIEGIDGIIDILADGEAWEIKTGQASSLDVYQLFMYMDIKNFNQGYLVAQDFSNGANFAVNYINENHKKVITLLKHTDFPITHPPDDEERREYY
jgi:hypothetical protein